MAWHHERGRLLIVHFFLSSTTVAYKKQALLHHPDRLKDDASPEERKEATKKFQVIADAYYILGDRDRRATYDRSHRRYSPTPGDSQSDANRVFGDVFEELLRVEGMRDNGNHDMWY